MWSLLFTVLLCSLPFSTAYNHPLVVVPGSFCSKLEVLVNVSMGGTRCPQSMHNTWQTLWLNPLFFEPHMLDCLDDILTMHFDAVQNIFVSAPGVYVRAGTFGSFDSLLPDSMADFSDVREALKKKGYKDGVDMFAAPYEWRRVVTATNFTAMLVDLIESAYGSNGNMSVHLLGHSTGGSMILYFLNQQSQEWKDKYILNFSPHFFDLIGIHIAAMITLSGNFGEVDNMHDIISGLSMFTNVSKTAYQSWDFYAWLLPNPRVYGSTRTLIYTSAPSANYTANDIMHLYSDLGAKGLAALYPTYSQLTGALSPPNVNTHCFFGSNVSTASGYTYTSLDGPSTTIYGPGDGMQDDTTNHSCLKWISMVPDFTFESQGFSGVHHTKLPVTREVVERVVAIVTTQ